MLDFLRAWLALNSDPKLVRVRLADKEGDELFELIGVDELGAVLRFEQLDQLILYRWPMIASMAPTSNLVALGLTKVPAGWFAVAPSIG